MPSHKACIDDGCSPELVRGATFDGVLEIPHINAPKEIIRPEGFTPFTQRHRAPSGSEALSFFEFDVKFADALAHPERYIGVAQSFAVFVPPDCSLYRDMPLALQVTNVYRSRAIGCYYQRHGANVYPLVRWGDERTYTDCVLPEPVAFLGVEKHSPVVVSTYGCIRGAENRKHFKAGIEAMVDYLEPSLVLVHGPMPASVFSNVVNLSEFVCYPDWTTRMRGGD